MIEEKGCLDNISWKFDGELVKISHDMVETALPLYAYEIIHIAEWLKRMMPDKEFKDTFTEYNGDVALDICHVLGYYTDNPEYQKVFSELEHLDEGYKTLRDIPEREHIKLNAHLLKEMLLHLGSPDDDKWHYHVSICKRKYNRKKLIKIAWQESKHAHEIYLAGMRE